MAELLRNSINVVGGKIRVTCPRCSRKKYVEVPPNTRRRVVRCVCGKSQVYLVNYRKDNRESISGKAQMVLTNATEAKIRLCDSSTSGIGFLVPREYTSTLSCGQEIRIKYKSGSGSTTQRKICIKNIMGNRVGGQYTNLGVSL